MKLLGYVLLVGLAIQTTNALVIGVDLGSRFFKVGLLQAGKPYHVILNTESKRRTSTAVSILGNGERLFGDTAQGAATRKAKDTFLLPTTVLGRTESDNSLHWMTECLLPYEWSIDETRGTYRVKSQASDTTYSIEEIVAMILEESQALASEAAGVVIKDAVISVPPFFTQQQREAIFDAADIAGLTVTGLINDHTSVALLYGVEKEKNFKASDEPQFVMFFDMGATSTYASVVRFGSTGSKLDKKGNKTVGEYWIKSVNWDETLGALSFDNIIVDKIATTFNAKNGVSDGGEEDVRNFPSAVARMRKAAEKAKEVLSTIGQTAVTIEGLWNDIDFSMVLERAEFEAAAADLINRVLVPVKQSLEDAQLEVSDLAAIEVVGGGSRIPSVQSQLKTFLGRDVSMSLNGDDAVALGATLFAAKVSPAHRMREFVLRDYNPYAVNVRIRDVGEAGAAEEGKVEVGDGEAADVGGDISREVFPKGSKMPVNKRLSFSRSQDFDVFLDYGSDVVLPAGTARAISHFRVSGIAEAIERYGDVIVVGEEDEEGESDEAEKKAKASVSLHLSPMSTVELARYEASISILQKEQPKPNKTAEKKAEDKEADGEEEKDEDGDKEKDEDGDKEKDEDGDKEKDEDGDKEKGEEDENADDKDQEQDKETDGEEKDGEEKEPEAEGDAAEDKAADDKEDEEKEDEAAEPVFKVKQKHLRLNSDTIQRESVLPRLNPKQLAVSRDVLATLTKEDKVRKELEASKNELETHIYGVRDFLYSAEDLDLVVTEEDKEKIMGELTNAEDWLYEDGANADIEVYREKLVEVQEVSSSVRFRHSELTLRPNAIEQARAGVATIFEKLDKFNSTKPWLNVTIKAQVANKTRKFEEWLNVSVAEQEEKSLLEDPAFTAADVARKFAPVEKAFNKLALTPKPKPKLKPFNSNFTRTNSTRGGKASNSTRKGGEDKQKGDDADDGGAAKQDKDDKPQQDGEGERDEGGQDGTREEEEKKTNADGEDGGDGGGADNDEPHLKTEL